MWTGIPWGKHTILAWKWWIKELETQRPNSPLLHLIHTIPTVQESIIQAILPSLLNHFPLCTNILLLLPSLGNPVLRFAAPSSYGTISRLSILTKLLEIVVNTHCHHCRSSHSLLNPFWCAFASPVHLNSYPVHQCTSSSKTNGQFLVSHFISSISSTWHSDSFIKRLLQLALILLWIPVFLWSHLRYLSQYISWSSPLLPM